MRKIFTLTVIVLVLLATALPSQFETKAKGDFEGNAACTTCIENAAADRDACFAAWDYGDGDPDCNDKYNRAVSDCQTTLCIY